MRKSGLTPACLEAVRQRDSHGLLRVVADWFEQPPINIVVNRPSLEVETRAFGQETKMFMAFRKTAIASIGSLALGLAVVSFGAPASAAVRHGSHGGGGRVASVHGGGFHGARHGGRFAGGWHGGGGGGYYGSGGYYNGYPDCGYYGPGYYGPGCGDGVGPAIVGGIIGNVLGRF
jgi:hypothetical protein